MVFRAAPKKWARAASYTRSRNRQWFHGSGALVGGWVGAGCMKWI